MHVTPSRSPLVTNYFPANIFLPRRCIHTHTVCHTPKAEALFHAKGVHKRKCGARRPEFRPGSSRYVTSPRKLHAPRASCCSCFPLCNPQHSSSWLETHAAPRPPALCCTGDTRFCVSCLDNCSASSNSCSAFSNLVAMHISPTAMHTSPTLDCCSASRNCTFHESPRYRRPGCTCPHFPTLPSILSPSLSHLGRGELHEGRIDNV